MYKADNRFESPENDARLWRYMNFTKFVSMLQKKALFFPKASILEPYEGKTHSDRMLKLFKAMDELQGKSSQTLKEVELENRRQDLVRELILINSWHEYPHESYAMWKIYVNNDEGLAVNTTFSNFKKSFDVEKRHDVYIGKTHYWKKRNKDYLSYFFDKKPEYSYEQEVRAVVDLFSSYERNKDGFLSTKFGKELILQNGLYVKTNLDLLIKRVVISPYAPPWLKELVEDVLKKYKLNAEVVPSEMV